MSNQVDPVLVQHLHIAHRFPLMLIRVLNNNNQAWRQPSCSGRPLVDGGGWPSWGLLRLEQGRHHLRGAVLQHRPTLGNFDWCRRFLTGTGSSWGRSTSCGSTQWWVVSQLGAFNCWPATDAGGGVSYWVLPVRSHQFKSKNHLWSVHEIYALLKTVSSLSLLVGTEDSYSMAPKLGLKSHALINLGSSLPLGTDEPTKTDEFSEKS